MPTDRDRSPRARTNISEMSEPLRVALLSYRGNPHCGGQGVYVRHLSAELVGLGHEVTVFSGQPYPELDEGVELVRVPSLDLYRATDPFRQPRLRELASKEDLRELAAMRLGRFGEPRSFSRRVASVLSAMVGDFDVVHDNQCLGDGILALSRMGWPVVASVHHPVTVDRRLDLAAVEGARRAREIRRWYGFSAMQARVARRLPALLTVSESSRHDIVAEMGVAPEAISVVAAGVDASVFRPRPEVARVAGRILTTASADVALKGLVPLLEALAKLRAERDDAHLVVVGRPREDGPVPRLIERLALSDAVEFHHEISDHELVTQYARCSVAVVPSLYEGFSLPAVEAMACGVPLVATTGGALPEVVGTDGAAALLVAPDDPDALCGAIGDVLADEELAVRLGAAGRARATAQFSWRACAVGTAAAYHRLLAGSKTC